MEETYNSRWTGAQIDDAIGDVRENKDSWTRPNLLDNSVFLPGCLVDQRGGELVVPPNTPWFTSLSFNTMGGETDGYYVYTPYNDICGSIQIGDATGYVAAQYLVRRHTGTGYGIDRWSIIYNPNNAAILIDNTGIKLVGTAPVIWAQSLPAKLSSYYNGKIVTLSALLSDGNLIDLTTEFPVSGQSQQVSASGLSIYIISAAHAADGYAKFGVIFGAENVSIIAAKLELGTTQTLAHQDDNGNWVLKEIPDYGEQLARCQRQFQLYSSADKRPSKAIDCRPTMRTDPVQGTIIIGGVTYYYNDANL